MMNEEDVPYFFAVPQALRNERPHAYIPRVVSLGPFHHNKSEFFKSENYKRQLIANFKYQSVFDKLTQKIGSDLGKEIKKSYEQLDINNESMLWPMMARDTLFLLEVLRSMGELTDSRRGNVGHTILDPWRKGPLLLAIHADIVKLEKQIPLCLLKHALRWKMVISAEEAEEELDKILQRACLELSPFLMNSSYQKPNQDRIEEKHIVEYLYNTIVWAQNKPHQDNDPSNKLLNAEVHRNRYKGKPKMDLPSAAELHRRGVKFVAFDTGKLSDIRFDKKSRRFYLPAIRMDDRTEVVLRNLVAHEALVELEERVLLSYVDMMDRLVDTASDVAVLKKSGVFRSDMGCDEEVAAAWNGIGRSLWKSGYKAVDEAVGEATEYYRTKWRVIIAEFMQLHFAKPWRAVSVAAACILLLLAFAQTYLTFEQLRLQRKCPCN